MEKRGIPFPTFFYAVLFSVLGLSAGFTEPALIINANSL